MVHILEYVFEAHNKKSVLVIRSYIRTLQRLKIYAIYYAKGTLSNICESLQNVLLHTSGPNEALPESCDFFLASCADQLQFCLVHCRGPSIPYSIMMHFNKDSRVLEPISILEPNSQLGIAVSDVNLPKVTTFTVPSSEGTHKNIAYLRPILGKPA